MADKTETAEMRCPHCGQILDMDSIYMKQMEDRFRESNAKMVEEAVASQKAADETEVNNRIAMAVDAAKAEQQAQIERLLNQVEILTKTIEANGEEAKRTQEQIFELQQQAQSADLEVQKKLNEKSAELYQKARQEADEEKELEIAALQKKLSDANAATQTLQRKLEQGSQQLQGEVQELNLARYLREEFFLDDIEEVATGKNGADIIQTIKDRSGRECGKIVWESKNVKTWKNDFITKLRDDMQRVGGDVGVIVSTVFGKNMLSFTQQNGTWLVKPSEVLPMARLLRDGIIRANEARLVEQHKESVQGAVYDFITSPQFRNRLENIGRQYRTLDEEINKTKDTMMRHWSTQRALIDQLIENTQGILGDVGAYMLPEGDGRSESLDDEERYLSGMRSI